MLMFVRAYLLHIVEESVDCVAKLYCCANWAFPSVLQ